MRKENRELLSLMYEEGILNHKYGPNKKIANDIYRICKSQNFDLESILETVEIMLLTATEADRFHDTSLYLYKRLPRKVRKQLRQYAIDELRKGFQKITESKSYRKSELLAVYAIFLEKVKENPLVYVAWQKGIRYLERYPSEAWCYFTTITSP